MLNGKITFLFSKIMKSTSSPSSFIIQFLNLIQMVKYIHHTYLVIIPEMLCSPSRAGKWYAEYLPEIHVQMCLYS